MPRRMNVPILGIVVGVLAAACTGSPIGSKATASAVGDPPVAPSGTSTPAPTPPTDPFAHLPYRIELPEEWVVLGSDDYDGTIDRTPDVADWLARLGLVGPNAMRAYEPVGGAAGLRLAMNQTMWDVVNAGALAGEGPLAELPGVADEPVAELIPVGAAKATLLRWTQSIDWGNGVSSSRNCAGYVYAGEFDPVSVVFSWPTETDRLTEVESIMDTIAVVGNAVASLPPGATPTPAPSPGRSNPASDERPPATHDDPALEAMLPDIVDGIPLEKDSLSGDHTAMTDDDPLLAPFGKQPADLSMATAQAFQPRFVLIRAVRLRGVPGRELLEAMLEPLADDSVTWSTIAGHDVAFATSGWLPSWSYARDDVVYALVARDEAEVASLMATIDRAADRGD